MIDWEIEPAPFAQFVVHGTPAPQGSKTPHPIFAGSGSNRHFTGRVAMVESADWGRKDGVKDWRGDVVRAALALVRCNCSDPGCVALRPGFPVDGPILARMFFTFERPRSHYRTGRNAGLLRDAAPIAPDVKPDVSKLARSTEDALKDAGIYKDDARIVRYSGLGKVYAGEDPEALGIPGARIGLWRMVRKEAPAAALPTVVQETVDLLSALDALDY